MFIHRTANDGHQKPRIKNNGPSQAKNAFVETLERVDVPEIIRQYPYQSIAVASGVGAIIGLTVGSRLMRMLVGSVGMYTVSELLRRYAKKTLDDFKATELGEEMPAEH